MKKALIYLLCGTLVLTFATGCEKSLTPKSNNGSSENGTTIDPNAKKNLNTTILSEKIKGKNNIWENAYTEQDESGLYAQTTELGTTYYFRGEPKNNYLKFAGIDFRIIRVNEDGSIRIISEEGTNNNKGYQYNDNSANYTSMYYSDPTNNVKKAIDEWYAKTITGNNANKVVENAKFCEAARLNGTNPPSFDCKTDENGKGKLEMPVGLITYDETIFAGGWHLGMPKYYLVENEISTWTMTAAYYHESSFENSSTACTWYLDGGVGFTFAVRVYYPVVEARPVLNLKSDVLVTGNGTKDKPYIVLE